MKTAFQPVSMLIVAILLLSSVQVFSQAPISKVILENEKVKVTSVEFKPGDITPTHSHPDHVLYVINGGKLEITVQGKDPVVVELNDGDAKFIPAVTHVVKNIGTTTIRLIATEIKPAGPNK